jgi:imidazole glycerol-phosphate synthase subunit HisF
MRRIIRFDIKKGFVIKGKQFEGFRKLGPIDQIVGRYVTSSEVEFFFYDLVATLFGMNSVPSQIKGLLEQVFLPVCVGGGLHTEEQVESCIQDGVDRVAVNLMTFEDKPLVKKLCSKYGSQAIVASVEARKLGGQWAAMHSTAREVGSNDLYQHLKELEDLGVGEVFLTAVDSDGMLNGFPVELLDKIGGFTELPYVLSGGFNSFEMKGLEQNFPFVKGVAISRALHEGLVSI